MPRKKTENTEKPARKRTKKAEPVAPPSVDVLENVVRVEEVEALRFAKIDAEIRNAQQGSRLIGGRQDWHRELPKSLLHASHSSFWPL